MPEAKLSPRADEPQAESANCTAACRPPAIDILRKALRSATLPADATREGLLRRHDLAWIDPTHPEVTCPAPAELEAWAARRLPLVVGRQDGRPGGVRMGFTVPGTGPRRRVEVRASPAAILVHGAPPPLDDLLAYGPPEWQAPLAEVARALCQAGLKPRAYGSLVTQAFSGEACIRPGSDVDILVDCDSRDAALAALDILAHHGEGSPRLDGEIRLPHGWAVAWRELAQARARGGQVLAKSASDLQLMSPEDFLGATLIAPLIAPIPTGADHGSPRNLRAVPGD